MGEIKYLTVEDVVVTQDAVLERMNEPPAVLLHLDKLESALGRCRNVAYYEGADLVRQAVILAVAISQNQPFLDGNKRAGFAAAAMFLRINGLLFRGAPLDMARFLELVAEAKRGDERKAAEDRFEAWLGLHVIPDKQD